MPNLAQSAPSSFHPLFSTHPPVPYTCRQPDENDRLSCKLRMTTAAMAGPIIVRKTIGVKPSRSTPSCVLTLSTIDSQLFLRFSIEYLLVYEACGDSLTRASMVDRLTKALGQALTYHYPLVGRIVKERDCPNLKVVCKGEGVAMFVEAEANEWTLEDLKGTPGSVHQHRELLRYAIKDVLGGSPPVVMQLTWLADGAAVLAVGFNHCLTDGIGSVEFLNLFAGFASSGIERSPEYVWDRHLFDRAISVSDPASHPEFTRVDDLCGFLSRFDKERLVPTSFCFTKKELDELKTQAAESTSDGGSRGRPSFTSFEVLAAQVWRSWASALELPPNQILRLLFSVNIRNRVEPKLPKGYYGNGFVLACARTTAENLTSCGLGGVSAMVSEAKERVNDKYVREVVDRVSGSSPEKPDQTGVLILSDWSKMGLHTVNFGIGKPVQIRSVSVDRYCLFLPVFDALDALKVMLAMPATAVGQYARLMDSTASPFP